jgi:hypothetical protein
MARTRAVEKIRQIWESEELEGSALRHWYITVEEAIQDFEKRGFKTAEEFISYVLSEIENTPDWEDWENIAESLYE